ncbi:MAG: phosphoribosyltransferase [Gemmatimonadetes bacterium]|nr:phosphoribosyltransferase [Gemmatimonadota bacterium]
MVVRLLQDQDAPIYDDRREAGRALAHGLAPYRGAETVVLGIARGGVEVAAEVAERLESQLDVVVARKLGAPGAPELALGAVTADGRRFLNDEVIASLGVSPAYLKAETEAQMKQARARELRYRNLRVAVELAGRVVIVVDDGLATGATMRASLRSVRAGRLARLIAAVPVASTQACEGVESDADALVCLYRTPAFGAVGFYYRNFEPVEDARVEELLEAAHARVERAVPTLAGPI